MSAPSRHARALFAPLGPTYDRVGAVLSFGQDPRWRRFLVSRLPADGGTCSTSRRARGSSRRAARAGLPRHRARPERGDARARAERGSTAASSSWRRRPSALPFPDASFDHLTFTYLLRYVDDPAATLRELARVVRPGGTIAMLEFGVPRGLWRPRWDLWVGVGLPLAGRAPLARAGTRSAASSARRSARSTPRIPSRALLELWRDAGIADVARAPPEPRRRRRRLGATRRAVATTAARPAFYALGPGGWRDYVTLLHLPYTAWHLSYVVVGGCLAPTVAWWTLGLTVLAFALAMGVGAHALDELDGRPLATRIPSGCSSRSRSRRSRPRPRSGSPSRSSARSGSSRSSRSARSSSPPYNLELFGGRLHTDLWFALAWGAFPVAHRVRRRRRGRSALEALLAAGWATLLSLAQRRLSHAVRRAPPRGHGRRRRARARGRDDRAARRARSLLAAPEGALRLLAAATVALAAALVALRV